MNKIKGFKPILSNVDLRSPSKALDSLPTKSGVYLFTLRNKRGEIPIYIGRTKSLAKRVRNYAVEFQAHAPNDYKLKAFADYVSRKFPDASLNLYFKRATPRKLNQNEAALIKKHDPVLNKRTKVYAQQKQELVSAYQRYFEKIFEAKFPEQPL